MFLLDVHCNLLLFVMHVGVKLKLDALLLGVVI